MILIVEDDPEICELENIALKNSGYKTSSFSNGVSFMKALESITPKLVILDIMLPDIDGLTLIKNIRKKYDFPIIFVTAKSTEVDMLKGFDLGADDYITKPFSVMEFVARVRAVLKRAVPTEETIISGGPFTIDEGKRTIRADSVFIKGITFKEFELFCKLLKSPDRVFSREQLMNEVWGNDFVGESRRVDMHIKTLRKKLGSYGEKIQTVRSVGYKLIL